MQFPNTNSAASHFRLRLYLGVIEIHLQLQPKYHLAAITDAQITYALTELNAIGLSGYLVPLIVSGSYDYRKLDERLFNAVLSAMKMQSSSRIRLFTVSPSCLTPSASSRISSWRRCG
jgi:FMN phosphatase YigB (HAD superfamily)